MDTEVKGVLEKCRVLKQKEKKKEKGGHQDVSQSPQEFSTAVYAAAFSLPLLCRRCRSGDLNQGIKGLELRNNSNIVLLVHKKRAFMTL